MEPSQNPWADIPKINHDLLAPLQNTPWTYFLLVGGLSVVVATGAGAWIYQTETGIGQVVIGTDYPFRGPPARGVEDVKANAPDAESCAAILGGTASKWF